MTCRRDHGCAPGRSWPGWRRPSGWWSAAPWLDNGLPLLVLAAGLVLSGRVAVDVTGRLGPVCALGAAVLVGAMGPVLARASEAHGERIELSQVVAAGLVVTVLSGASAAWVARRRTRAVGVRGGT